MNYDYPPEEKDCICRQCGEESDKEFCSQHCAKEYEADN
jgi:hypothetical protein